MLTAGELNVELCCVKVIRRLCIPHTTVCKHRQLYVAATLYTSHMPATSIIDRVASLSPRV